MSNITLEQIEQLKECMPRVINKLKLSFKNDIVPLMKALRDPRGTNETLRGVFSDVDSSQLIQEMTKTFSEAINSRFYMYLEEEGIPIEEDATVGSDAKIFNTLVEDKNTCSKSNDSWTGNGYKKTPWHILKRCSINVDTNELEFCLVYVVNLDTCVSSWTEPKGSNYSTLKIVNEDYDKIHCLSGKVSKISHKKNLTKFKKYLEFTPTAD